MITNKTAALLASGSLVALMAASASTAQAFSLNGLEVGINGGKLSGHMGEYVIDPNAPVGGGNRVSQLDWSFEDVTMVGLTASMNIGQRLKIRGEYWQDVGDANGDMVDYDWIDPFASNAPAPLTPWADDAWTDRSVHPDSPVKDATQMELSVAFQPFGSANIAGFAIAPRVIGGVRKDSVYMTSFGGTATYSFGGFRDTDLVFADTDEGIDYQQEFTTMFVGIGSDTSIGGIDLSIEGAIGQYDLEATDNHFNTGVRFEDSIDGGDFRMVKADASTSLGRFSAGLSHINLNAGIDYVEYKYETGDTSAYSRTTGALLGSTRGGAAAEMDATTVSLGLSMKF